MVSVCVPAIVWIAAGANASSARASAASGRSGSSGRIAGPEPSRAAATAASIRSPAEGGNWTACNGRDVTVVRLIGQIRATAGGRAVIDWKASGPADGQEYTDIRYETAEGIAKITINRPEVRNGRASCRE